MGGQIGGAMNVDNFRESIQRGHLPSLESVTSKGLFSEYFFDTGIAKTDKILESSYSFASSPNPLTGKTERYFTLGLNCAEDGKNNRNNLNCVIVLDISGSMGAPFDNVSDNGTTSEGNIQLPQKKKKKMEIAVDMLLELTEKMRPEDNIGIILFDNEVKILQPIRQFSLIDKESLIEKIKNIHHRGGTNMELGYIKALGMLKDFREENYEDTKDHDSRILFLTDANPNTGGGKLSLLGMNERAAEEDQIFTTFFGVGLDFNVKIVEEITKVKGSNYFAIHSAQQFKKILVEDFNYIVTPLVFNTLLFLESEGLEIDQIYGAQFDEESTNCLLKVDTVCAGPLDERGVKGGMILVRLKDKLTPKLEPSQDLKFTLRYELKNGEKVQIEDSFNFKEKMDEMIKQGKIYESNGVRKAILLARFTDFMKEIISHQQNKIKNGQNDYGGVYPTFFYNQKKLEESLRLYGINPESVQMLKITPEIKEELKSFISYFKKEMKEIGDNQLVKELDILDQIRYSAIKDDDS